MLQEGSTIGTYRVLRKLGEGGMGAVYIGEHALLGRKAAIKVLLPELSAHKEIVQRFFNEAKAVTQIADPGIVQVFDFGYDNSGSAYIVMELLDGEPMDRRLQRTGRLAPADALQLAKQICMSLQAAHDKGIIHRDLKPENIFIVGDPAVTGGERAKILDFGIAKLSGDEPSKMKTQTGMVMGTPVYMSPEQCRGAGSVDARSDIYSFACVLMTMLTGAPPFDGSGSGDLIVAHLTHQPPLAASRVPDVPPVIDDILQRCLAKDPAQRLQTMTEFAQAIGSVEQQIMGFKSGLMLGNYYSPTITPGPVLQNNVTPGAPYQSYATPGSRPQPTTAASKPTTLSSAAGSTTRPPAKSRAPLIAAVGGIAIAVAVGVVFLATSRNQSVPAEATTSRSLDEQPTGSSIDPSVGTTSTTPAEATYSASMTPPTLPATPTADASIPDAPAQDAEGEPQEVGNAGKRIHRAQKHPTGGKKNEPMSTKSVDRGD